MFNNHVTNDELTRLLHKFAEKKGGKAELHSAQRQFFNYLNRELDRRVRYTVNHNDELAKVALQEAWAKIFESASQYDPTKSSVKTWTKSIAFRCAVDELRRYYRRIENQQEKEEKIKKGKDKEKNISTETNNAEEKKYSKNSVKTLQDWMDSDNANAVIAEDLNNLVCPLLHTDDVVYGKQLQLAIKACIELLPHENGPNYRQAMELCLNDEFKYEEMTAILAAQSPQHANINAEQVRKWVMHAKIKMQACISQKLGWGNDRSKDRNNQ